MEKSEISGRLRVPCRPAQDRLGDARVGEGVGGNANQVGYIHGKPFYSNKGNKI